MELTDAREWVLRLYGWHHQGRLAHAYLCTAEYAQGLHDFALRVIELLLCEQPKEGAACGDCRSCRQLAGGNHPDVEWLAPDGAALKIQQMRAAIKADALMTGAGNLHIFVLEDVHKLTVEAANAILKWVEEPFANRLFLLLTPAPAALLPTLRSRVLLLRIKEGPAPDSGNAQDFAVFSLDDEAKMNELQGLVEELGETAYRGDHKGWLMVSDKWSKWNFSASQSLAFADWLIRYLHGRASAAADPVSIHRYSRLALAAFRVRRQMLSHVNSQLAWETFLLNAAKKDGERLGG